MDAPDVPNGSTAARNGPRTLIRGPVDPLAMKHWILGACLLALVCALLLVRGLRTSTERTPGSPVAAPKLEAKVELSDEAAISTTQSRLEPVAAPAERSAVTPEPDARAPTAPVLAEIRGRFVLAGGAPAVGVSLSVRGWGANQERELN